LALATELVEDLEKKIEKEDEKEFEQYPVISEVTDSSNEECPLMSDTEEKEYNKQ
jgi:hypothetical protein